MRMRNICLAILWTTTWLAGSASAHTLFVKPDTMITTPQEIMEVNIINGTFLESENRIKKSTASSAEIFGPGGEQLDFADGDWLSVDKMSVLRARFPEPGNYIIAVTTFPQKITITPEDFNFYLRYEGLKEQQEEREELGEAETEVVERYQKFAKALVQVGDEQSANFADELGLEVEIVPSTNPYTLSVGDVFRARVLRDGKPLANMRVFATHEGYLPLDDEGIYDEAVKVVSDADGVVEFEITAPGQWYVRFIDLQRESDSEYWYSGLLSSIGADEKRIVYESKWATLTFEIQ